MATLVQEGRARAICASLVLQLITRMQGKQEWMAAKLAAASSAAGEVVDG